MAATIVAGSTVQAQGLPIAAGQRVRLLVEGQSAWIEGILLTAAQDSVVVSVGAGENRAIARSAFTSVEGRRRQSRTRVGALFGAGAGGLIGLIATATDSCESSLTVEVCDGVGGSFAVYAALVGAAFGAGVGSLMTTERWVPGFIAGAGLGRSASFGLTWVLRRSP